MSENGQGAQALVYEFLSVDQVCRRVGDSGELDFSSNSLYTISNGGSFNFHAPEFFLDDDDMVVGDLSSPDRKDMRCCEAVFDDSFVAALKDVCIEKFSRLPIVSNTLNIFLDPTLALAESYHNKKFNEWIVSHLGEKVPLEVSGHKVLAKVHEYIQPVTMIDTPCYCLTSRFVHHNYYHWMLEGLPRLRFLQNIPNCENIPIVLPAVKLRPFHYDSIKALGLKNPIVGLSGQMIKFKRLYFPSFLEPGAVTTGQVEWLRSNLHPDTSRAGWSARPRRLYVSRRNVQGRTLTNESEVISMLISMGFEVVDPGAMSLEEQVSTFASAGIVISPHGAGNTNIVFCRPEAVLIELVPEAMRQSHYWMLASVAGIRYGRVLCEDNGPLAIMTVDLGRLKEMLGRVGL